MLTILPGSFWGNNSWTALWVELSASKWTLRTDSRRLRTCMKVLSESKNSWILLGHFFSCSFFMLFLSKTSIFHSIFTPGGSGILYYHRDFLRCVLHNWDSHSIPRVPRIRLLRGSWNTHILRQQDKKQCGLLHTRGTGRNASACVIGGLSSIQSWYPWWWWP